MTTDYFLLPGEKPNADTLLKRMGEYDRCLATGETEDLTCIPVDFNLSNILPSNMARVSKKLLDKAPLVVEYENSVFLNASVPFTVEFRSCYQFYEHNMDVLAKMNNMDLLSEEQVGMLVSDNPLRLIDVTMSCLHDVWWYLVKNHAKGLDKITLLRGNLPTYFSLDWSAAQTHMMGDLERSKPKSNIITPHFGV
jgi:hypothetical protein